MFIVLCGIFLVVGGWLAYMIDKIVSKDGEDHMNALFERKYASVDINANIFKS